jgi:hypothetical protein
MLILMQGFRLVEFGFVGLSLAASMVPVFEISGRPVSSNFRIHNMCVYRSDVIPNLN